MGRRATAIRGSAVEVLGEWVAEEGAVNPLGISPILGETSGVSFPIGIDIVSPAGISEPESS